MKSRKIILKEFRILKNRLLLFPFYYSKNIQRFFWSNMYYVEYDKDIHEVCKSILYIPFISNIITVAWAIGADIYVKELDKNYLESLEEIKSVMTEWYPQLPFSTNIYVDNVVSNKFNNDEYGLLFSGGIDSTFSYYRNKDKKQNLIMIWGADIPLTEEKYWKNVKKKYEDWSEKENININFIKTNIATVLNINFLNSLFGRYLTDFNWWGSFQHSITLLGLCAPLTVENIGTIMIASSYTREFNHPWVSHPLIDNKISFGDVRVIHNGHKLSRQQKIRFVLKKYIQNHEQFPPIRVCYKNFNYFNCNKCEKCSRTITGLVLENIDPNKFGFKINGNYFNTLKKQLVEGKFTFGEDEIFMWRDIQRHIPEIIDHNLYNSKDFFKWLKTFNFSRNINSFRLRSRRIILRMILEVVSILPKSLKEGLFYALRFLKMVFTRPKSKI